MHVCTVLWSHTQEWERICDRLRSSSRLFAKRSSTLLYTYSVSANRSVHLLQFKCAMSTFTQSTSTLRLCAQHEWVRPIQLYYTHIYYIYIYYNLRADAQTLRPVLPVRAVEQASTQGAAIIMHDLCIRSIYLYSSFSRVHISAIVTNLASQTNSISALYCSFFTLSKQIKMSCLFYTFSNNKYIYVNTNTEKWYVCKLPKSQIHLPYITSIGKWMHECTMWNWK